MRILALVFGFLASSALAEPSFNCSAKLNPTEKQICAAARLGQLDRTMAQSFFDRIDALGGRDQRLLRTEQLAWLKWRNSCGENTNCLEQRYLDRIRDLYGVPVAGGTGVGPDQVVEKRLRNNALEIVYADGRIERMSPVDGTFELFLPEGFDQAKLDAARGIIPFVPESDPVNEPEVTEDGDLTKTAELEFQEPQAVQVQDDSFLVPDDCDPWMASIDNELWAAVEAMLPETDRQGYNDLVAAKPCPSRLQGHIQAINFLANR